MIVASAQTGSTPAGQTTTGTSNCTACHTEYEMTWENGAHGKAGSDPVFLDEWAKQGKPGACLVCHTTGYDPSTATFKADGVTCEACHGPAPADHPKTPMPVDRSPDLCGRCHSDTRFGWQDWKVSTHYQRGMDCATCHDPHSASLKKIAGPLGGVKPDDVSALCINCHKEHSMNFPYTIHSQKGVTCVDCHVKHIENTDSTAHQVPDHSFNASLDSCNKCHAQEMHSQGSAVSGTSSPAVTAQPTEAVQLASVTPEPTPVSPIGFSALAGLLGLAGGMVLAPWLERWYQKVTKHDQEEKND
jgi:predicted CXXCH cytochrome family protein